MFTQVSGMIPIFIKTYGMPEIFRMFGLRFFFYANDHKPIHVHVESGDGEAKFNIGDKHVELINSYGMKKKDLKLAETLINQNRKVILESWNKFFK